MGLFGKKKEKQGGCSCGGNCDAQAVEKAKVANKSGSNIKVLGSGCAKCKTLEESTKMAIAELGLADTVDHITDFTQIATYGVMTTPALVVDNKVVSYGKVLSKDEVVAILKKQRGI